MSSRVLGSDSEEPVCPAEPRLRPLRNNQEWSDSLRLPERANASVNKCVSEERKPKKTIMAFLREKKAVMS